MLLSGRVYDVTKSVTQIYLPALGTLYFALSLTWGLPAAEQVLGTIAAIDTFLGVCLGISTKTYNSTEAKYDGTVDVKVDADGNKKFLLNLNGDPNELDQKGEIVFKVNTE